ncbi:coiled-coil domain-containing protein 63-like [Atheta coriaria]|uniref:coiled-coil domain-containing protein 63-like n=1 Tax=Dalotia coriaria TaxID=877792 RepID=UPI0031F3CA24
MQIVMAKKNIVELRGRTLTEVQCTAKIYEEQSTLEALENKLDTATKRFCTTIASNRKLREDIDHLLIERANFNKSWDRLCNNLSHGKKFMLDLIEQATIAYDQREEWCQKLSALRTKAYNEYLSHTSEMTNIQRQIDYGDKLQNFLNTKGQRRIMRNLMRKEQERRELQRKEMQELLENYNNIIENIREFMGETNIKIVGERFCLNEINNFSKFRYVNELNKEMESLSDDLIDLHFRIDAANAKNQYYQAQQKNTIEALVLEYERTKAEADLAENNFNRNEETLNELLNGIGGLFQLCRCSNAPLMELLGQNSTINIHNALMYLKILEKKVNDMIVTVYYKDIKKYKKSETINAEKMTRTIITITDLVSRDPCPLCVEQALVSDVIDTLQKVMEKDQIAEKLEEAIEKRGFNEVVHNVSGCHLPKSRAIIQRRFQ